MSEKIKGSSRSQPCDAGPHPREDFNAQPSAAPLAKLREAASALQLIAAGWEVIESDGSQMTIQAPEHWDEDGATELVIDTAALFHARETLGDA